MPIVKMSGNLYVDNEAREAHRLISYQINRENEINVVSRNALRGSSRIKM